ncbi:MAG: zf-TFIIB domain-containing protein [Candidatus Brocadiia bacterium]
MRTLECPRCGEPLVVAEYELIEVDSCAACGGLWLDGGELEALLGSHVPPLEGPDPELGPPQLDCPICVDKLAKDRHSPSGVVVDRCPHGDGIWLDRGELESILAAGPQPPADADAADQEAARALARFFEGQKPQAQQPEAGDERL